MSSSTVSFEASPALPLRTRLCSNFIRAPLFFLTTGFFGLLAILVSLLESKGRAQHQIARIWARLCLVIAGARMTVIGHGNCRPLAVYASNHSSFIDAPVIFAGLPLQFRILARQSLWKWPFIGWYLNRSGQIPVDEESAGGSISSLSRASRALKAGMPLFIFPEGGRTIDGSLQPFMSGPAFLAIRAKVPLVPIALLGTYEVLPIHTHHFRPRPIKLVIGEPIDSSSYTVRQAGELSKRLQEEITRLFQQYEDPMHPTRLGQRVESGANA